MLNGKHRARLLAETISELQRLHKKIRGCAEDALVREALEKLQSAREKVLGDMAEGAQ